MKDYLLKPIMKEEMEAALKHVAEELRRLTFEKKPLEEETEDPLSEELRRIRKMYQVIHWLYLKH